MGDAHSGFQLSSVAHRIIVELGDIRVAASGPGVDRARGSFHIDPLLALGEEDRFARFEPALGVRVFPLGEEGGHAFLAVDPAGQVIALMDEILWRAPSIKDAVESILLGKKLLP